MTPTAHADAAPPAWAAAILPLLLPRDEAETVTGDLVEHYHESVFPASGRLAADAWFVRQVAGFVLRVPLAWSLLVAAFIAGRFALDTFVPPASYFQRSFFTTWSSIALYLLAGGWAARRTGLARAGVLAAVTAHALGWTISGLMTIALFVGVIRNDPAMLTLFHQTGGWGEQWFLPLMLTPVVVALGALGGACGRLFAKRPRT